MRNQLKNSGKKPSQEIEAALELAKAAEEAKVQEGEEWINSISKVIRLFNGNKPFASEYVGFTDGRRTFKIQS